MFKTCPTCDSFSTNIVPSLSIRMKFISCPFLDLMCVQLMFLFENVDGKAVMSKEEIEAVDYKNNTVTFNVIRGLLKESYKNFKFIVQATPKGEGAFICCPFLHLMCVQLMFLFENVDGKAVMSKEEIKDVDDKHI